MSIARKRFPIVSIAKSATGSLLAISIALTPACQAANNNKPQYMPPIAPSVDTTAPATQQTIDNGRSGTSSSESQLPPEEQAKELLKQALMKHSQGDVAGAERLFRQVLTIDPSNPDANYNLGAIAEDRHDLQGALKYFKVASRANPNDADIRDAMNAVQEQLQKQQASGMTADKLQRHARLQKLGDDATTAYKAGNFDQAITNLKAVEKEEPNDPNIQFGLGQAYRGKGDNQKAREYLSKAADLAPNNQLYLSALRDVNNDLRQTADDARDAQSARRARDNSDDSAMDDNRNISDSRNQPLKYRRDDRHTSLPSGWTDDPDEDNPAADGSGLKPFTKQGERQLPGRAQYSQYDDVDIQYGSPAAIPMGTPMGMGTGLGSLIGRTYSYSTGGFGMMGTPLYSMPMGGYNIYGGYPAYPMYGNFGGYGYPSYGNYGLGRAPGGYSGGAYSIGGRGGYRRR